MVPFSRARFVNDTVVSQTWWLYDVAANRARPLPRPPANLDTCSKLAIWRKRLAYTTCNGVYVRVGRRIDAVPLPPAAPYLGDDPILSLRGATLFGELDDGSDGIYLTLLADASGPCRQIMPGLGRTEAGDLSAWWITRRFIAWREGGTNSRIGPLGAVLGGARLRGRCRTPAPAGTLFTPPAGTGVGAVDDRFVYYGDSRTIRRHPLPAAPSTAPPPDDDFERAAPLTGDLPLSATVVIGAATTQPGEPVASTDDPPTPWTRTVWYAFRPAVTGPVLVQADRALSVYTGTTLQTLTPVVSGAYSPVQLDAVAGQIYWLQFGSASAFPDFDPFTVTIQAP